MPDQLTASTLSMDSADSLLSRIDMTFKVINLSMAIATPSFILYIAIVANTFVLLPLRNVDFVCENGLRLA